MFELEVDEVRRSEIEALGFSEQVNLACARDAAVEDLEVLAASSEVQLRRYVACNPATPPYLLNVLGGDADEAVRWHVAFHGKTDFFVAMMLRQEFGVLKLEEESEIGRQWR